MSTKDKIYVGTLIRDEIRKQQVKNGFVISKMNLAGLDMSDVKFSNKIYGERDSFKKEEIESINTILGTNFKTN